MTAPGPDFIFMLTRADRTIDDAESRLRDVVAAGVRHIGFKDVGQSAEVLRRLARAIRAAGAVTYLEMVGLGPETESASARLALDLGVDILMGGISPEAVAPIVADAPIRYYPFAGDVAGHPSVLTGDLTAVIDNARRRLDYPGVDGLDLLAYRFAGDQAALMRGVGAVAAGRPVVVAGSLDRAERIEAVVTSGAAAFTVGTAALDGAFPGPATLADQIRYIIEVRDRAAGARTDRSPIPARRRSDHGADGNPA